MLATLQRAITYACSRNALVKPVVAARTLASMSCAPRPLASALVLPPCALVPPRLPLTCPLEPVPLRLPSLTPAVRLPLTPPPRPASPPPAAPPPAGDVSRREAARLIVIRRRKMRKHKLKKLRKRMRYVWAKVKLRRSIRREKAFQAEQMGMIAAANKFDARNYVDDIIEKSSTMPMSTVRGGKRLPYFIRVQMEGETILKPPK